MMSLALQAIAMSCAGISAIIVTWFLWARPAPDLQVKILLLLGIGVLPIGAALATNVAGYNTTLTRQFCSSCHLMLPYTNDSSDRGSQTLAARHARNELFGHDNCYTCHANYEMFGTITTKISGMHHVWVYYVEGARHMKLEDSIGKIELYEPFSNTTCVHCHSTTTQGFKAVNDHKGIDADLMADRVSCASAGCHGPAHPFSKLGKKEGAK